MNPFIHCGRGLPNSPLDFFHIPGKLLTCLSVIEQWKILRLNFVLGMYCKMICYGRSWEANKLDSYARVLSAEANKLDSYARVLSADSLFIFLSHSLTDSVSIYAYICEQFYIYIYSCIDT